ncbi:glycosyltransferase involved in cell wall biosynthesis [Georgenia soli]|uniref:Glycosyltransferase involved in cell wall biosynthesis n=1 Tax=Georgenia soli TaxID=638953 RepID=A0A2A9EJH9_9MICO|nr:glycosyltransferase [Georgenia soli]PFG38681.1 glycosyltransferase involved in cell wall biosynthesis [Georgenia soli]
MRVLAFGTYDVKAHPRVQVLIDGLREHGLPVSEIVEPLGLSTAQRVSFLQNPASLPRFVGRLLRRWSVLALRAVRLRGAQRPTHVLVGYLGHFDVLLARLLFPRAQIVLDHLIFAAGTARDRGAGDGLRTRLLGLLDSLALGAADVIVVDTPEHRELVPARRRDSTVVVPVGATSSWFEAPGAPEREGVNPLSVVFFGLFTPLQGTRVVGEALRILHDRGVHVRATLVGAGQDSDAVHAQVDGLPSVTWQGWVDGAELPALVASHDVCLGIFGTTAKALNVVPNKVYQGAAAGCVVVTSDTEPQRRALGDDAVLVPPGDAEALANALAALAGDPATLADVRRAGARRARERFTARAVTEPLVEVLTR